MIGYRVVGLVVLPHHRPVLKLFRESWETKLVLTSRTSGIGTGGRDANFTFYLVGLTMVSYYYITLIILVLFSWDKQAISLVLYLQSNH